MYTYIYEYMYVYIHIIYRWKHKNVSEVNIDEIKKRFLTPFSNKELDRYQQLSNGSKWMHVTELDFPDHLEERDSPMYRLNMTKQEEVEAPLLFFAKQDKKSYKTVHPEFMWSPDLHKINPRRARRSVRKVVDDLMGMSETFKSKEDSDEEEMAVKFSMALISTSTH